MCCMQPDIVIYSKRKNTTAAKAVDHIQPEIKKARVKKLIELGDKKLMAFTQEQDQRSSEVLFEREKEGYFYGHTSNYLKVRVKSDGKDLKNQILKVNLSHSGGKSLDGEVIGQ